MRIFFPLAIFGIANIWITVGLLSPSAWSAATTSERRHSCEKLLITREPVPANAGCWIMNKLRHKSTIFWDSNYDTFNCGFMTMDFVSILLEDGVSHFPSEDFLGLSLGLLITTLSFCITNLSHLYLYV